MESFKNSQPSFQVGIASKGEGKILNMGIGKKQILTKKDLPTFSVSNLAEHQKRDNQDLMAKDSDIAHILKERSSNVPSKSYKESILDSKLSTVKQESGNRVTNTRDMGNPLVTKQASIKAININIPTKPASFSLADLAKEHISCSPSSFSKQTSTSPKQHENKNVNPSVPGLSLAQLAQQQTGSSPTHSMIHEGKDDNTRCKVLAFSLSTLADQHSFKDSVLSCNLYDSRSKSTYSGISMTTLAQQHCRQSGPEAAASYHTDTQVISGSSFNSLLDTDVLSRVNMPPSSQVTPAGFCLSTLAAQHEKRTTDRRTTQRKSEDHEIECQGLKVYDTEKHLLPPPGFEPRRKVNLSALAAQHKMPEAASQTTRVLPTNLVLKPVKNVKEVLTTKPSIFGQALCCKYSKAKLETQSNSSEGLNQFSFSFTRQISKRSNTPTSDTHSIIPFNFSTPSPDDTVLQKQKGAFTRTGND